MQTPKTASTSLGDQIYQSLLCIMITAIVLSNTMVVIAIRRFLPLQTKCNRFVVNIAVADLLFACSVALMLLFDNLPASKEDHETYQDVMCFLRTGPPFVTVVITSMTLCAIGVDRYFAVCHLKKYPSIVTNERVTAFIVCTWTYALLFFFIPTFTAKPKTEYNSFPCLFETFLNCFHILGFAVHFTVVTIAAAIIYQRISLAVSRQCSSVEPLLRNGQGMNVPGIMTSDELERLKQAGQITRVYVIILISVSVATTPTLILYTTLGLLGKNSFEVRGIAIFCELLLFFQCLVNPIIFALKYKEFSIAFKKLVCVR